MPIQRDTAVSWVISDLQCQILSPPMEFWCVCCFWFRFNNLVSAQWASLVAQLVKNSPAMLKTPVWFLGQDDTLEKGQLPTTVLLGFPGGSDSKESACNVGGLGSFPGLRRFPWRREQLPTPVFWSRLYSPWGGKELDRDWLFTFTLSVQ